MTEPLLKVDGLRAGYTAPVVGPLSFNVKAGEVLGLAGPNGSGKSTLLKALANGARIFGGSVIRQPGVTIRWLEQQPANLIEMPFNGWEYLRYAEADFSAPPPYLARCLDQRVDSLSGGQYQLLCLWAAVTGRARLVLLDEPTNNLDSEGERILRDVLRPNQGERAVLIVSHERDLLERVSDRLLEVGA